jgi:NTE family protein
MKAITLALGGGGVKGGAHLGVLRVLEREGFQVRAVAGTSAGGLVGSLYAFGYGPDEIQRRLSQADPAGLFARQPDDAPAWLGVSGVRRLLEEALGDCDFADMHRPFAVTAVDMDTADLLVLDRGRVVEAVLATIAVPGVFPAATLDGRTLVDGGVLDPVPVSAARALAPGLPVVAVVLSPPVDEWGGLQQPRLLNSLPFLSRYISRFRFSQALNAFMRSIDIAGALLTELLLEIDRPEVVIRPNVRHIGMLDPVDLAAVALLGERAAELALPQLHRAVTWQDALARRLRPPRRPSRVRPPHIADFQD